MMLWYGCRGYNRITQNSLPMTITAKNFRDTVSWLAIIKAISHCNLTLVRHTWELKLTFSKFPSFTPERCLKCECIRMTFFFLLILSCSRDLFASVCSFDSQWAGYFQSKVGLVCKKVRLWFWFGLPCLVQFSQL